MSAARIGDHVRAMAERCRKVIKEVRRIRPPGAEDYAVCETRKTKLTLIERDIELEQGAATFQII